MNLFQWPNLFPLIWNYNHAPACKCILKFAVFYASNLFRDIIIRKVWLRLPTCHGDFLWLTFCNRMFNWLAVHFKTYFFHVLCIWVIITVRDCCHSIWLVSVMTLTIWSVILWRFIHFWQSLPLIHWNNCWSYTILLKKPAMKYWTESSLTTSHMEILLPKQWRQWNGPCLALLIRNSRRERRVKLWIKNRPYWSVLLPNATNRNFMPGGLNIESINRPRTDFSNYRLRTDFSNCMPLLIKICHG